MGGDFLETDRRMSKDERRNQILDSAMKIFTEKGYANSTTLEIAKAAGISEVTLFRHFSSKKEIFLEGIEPILFGSLKKALDNSNGRILEEKLLYMLTERISYISEHREIIKLILKEASLLKEVDNEGFIERTLQLIKNMLKEIGVTLDNENFTLRLLMGSILSFLYMPEDNEVIIKDYVTKITLILLEETNK